MDVEAYARVRATEWQAQAMWVYLMLPLSMGQRARASLESRVQANLMATEWQAQAMWVYLERAAALALASWRRT